MRILQIIDNLGSGGKERQFVELLKGLAREEDISCEAVIMSDLVLRDEIYGLGFPVHVIERKARLDLGAYLALRRIVSTLRPDIIHSWNTMCSAYAAPLAKLFGAKFVNGYVRDANPEAASALNRAVERFSRAFSDVVVGNSRAGLAAYGVSQGICIYNGFDPARLSLVRNDIEMRRALRIETPFVVGMAGRFDGRKDYATFFEAAQRIVAKRTDVTFVAIGYGEELSAFEKMFPVERYPQLRLLGFRKDAEDIINAFSVGVLVSAGEGISNAIMEYMALGKPVVATRSGGNVELVVDGETGFLVPIGDPRRLEARILELLDDADKASAFGARGRERIRTVFGFERMTQEYLELYRRLAGLPSRG